MVHVLTGHYPAGGSPKTMFQFFDNYNSGIPIPVGTLHKLTSNLINLFFFKGGNFTRFDYGEAGNLELYGTPDAPKYQMELVTSPVYLLWSQTDPVSTPQVFI